MNICRTDSRQFTLLIQRILDAKVLHEAESTALLTATEAACRSLQSGDAEAARRHVEQVVLFMKVLVYTDRFDLADVCAVIGAAHRLLVRNADCPAPRYTNTATHIP